MENYLSVIGKINAVVAEWKELRGSELYLFNYKLYDLSRECNNDQKFEIACGCIMEEWQESVREITGYCPEQWKKEIYFTHDNHNGSYFNFADTSDDEETLDFWANDIGLEWDSTAGEEWYWTDFEKAINATYGSTRFTTDRLTPEKYSVEEMEEIAEYLHATILPKIRETLNERKAIIALYNELKANQCAYFMEVEENEGTENEV